jgi:hypothetical protein
MIGWPGNLSFDMAGYGFRVHAFLFVLQQNRSHRCFPQHLYCIAAVRRELDAKTARFQPRLAKFPSLWKVVDAQQSERGVRERGLSLCQAFDFRIITTLVGVVN